ncbi:MAG TPA: peptide chain release factor 3 [Pedomonas sp.]|nr:peptide chain release factor 3 [Pedomonas sp.]
MTSFDDDQTAATAAITTSAADTAGDASRASARPEQPSDRRTFAIIAHPDAGKTTLTEKLLLFGGAIRLAGQVKARGERRRARSDWMDIEKNRGISVTSSVMTFERGGITFNLLDTPGHEDFSEDTYRTLTAVDSAVMVIDAAKGIESQTRKLLEVCRIRNIPIITFINKIDREAQSPFELLDEIESTLALDVTPMSWPVGSGSTFHGVYDLRKHEFLTSSQGRGGAFDSYKQLSGLEDEALDKAVPADVLAEFRETAELALSAYPEPDREAYLNGDMTPVFFGSALKDFSVEQLLDAIGALAPSPRSQPADTRTVDASEAKVTGFVFKVQANMDPNHRDRVAFFRLCSGKFRRGMKLKQIGTGKTLAVSNPIFFFAQDRELADEAMPGDIIGIPNHGTLRVGDTLTEGEELRFTGIPNFAPDILRRVQLGDPLRVKAMRQALQDLAEEGVIQVFRPAIGSNWIVGVVGQLQLEVLASRALAEYKVEIKFEDSPFDVARWVSSADPAALKRFMEDNRSDMAEDRDGHPVFMARSQWRLDRAAEDYKDIKFSAFRERA